MSRTLSASVVLCLLAAPVAAQDGNFNVLVAADFELACLRTAPSLDAAADAFTKAGFKRPHPALFTRDGTPEIGMLAQSPDGRTRTCAVGMQGGDVKILQAVIDHIAETSWPDAQQVQTPKGDVAYVRKQDASIATLTLSTSDPRLPVMNLVTFAPQGFGK